MEAQLPYAGPIEIGMVFDFEPGHKHRYERMTVARRQDEAIWCYGRSGETFHMEPEFRKSVVFVSDEADRQAETGAEAAHGTLRGADRRRDAVRLRAGQEAPVRAPHDHRHQGLEHLGARPQRRDLLRGAGVPRSRGRGVARGSLERNRFELTRIVVPPPARGRKRFDPRIKSAGEKRRWGSCIAKRPPPGTLRAPTSPLQGEESDSVRSDHVLAGLRRRKRLTTCRGAWRSGPGPCARRRRIPRAAPPNI